MDTLETRLSTRPRNINPEEWAVRVDLAACYRLIAHFGWDDLILTHNSARVPGHDRPVPDQPDGADVRRDHRVEPVEGRSSTAI